MDGAVEGIAALGALIFVIPALCAFIIAVINNPLRAKRESVEEDKVFHRHSESTTSEKDFQQPDTQTPAISKLDKAQGRVEEPSVWQNEEQGREVDEY